MKSPPTKLGQNRKEAEEEKEQEEEQGYRISPIKVEERIEISGGVRMVGVVEGESARTKGRREDEQEEEEEESNVSFEGYGINYPELHLEVEEGGMGGCPGKLLHQETRRTACFAKGGG